MTDLKELVDSVEGWLGDGEASELHRAALNAAAAEPVAVEIGSWKGKSTVAIASAFRERGAGTVYAVDPHEGTSPHETEGEPDTFAAFLANVERAGVAAHVTPVRARSREARPRVDHSVDLLFVDGSHEYDDV